jgi:UDP-N-acetylmuramate: L-alanyl-gamma-D-glutamyl-meso-diaminopimelate ligase
VYEPRSATACRALHQQAYVEAFDPADHVVLAPLGRELPRAEALDLDRLRADLAARKIDARASDSIDAIVTDLAARAAPGDTIVLLSNGAFGGIVDKLLTLLSVDKIVPDHRDRWR